MLKYCGPEFIFTCKYFINSFLLILTSLTKPNPLSLFTKTSATSPYFSNISLSSFSSQLVRFPTKSLHRPENFLSLVLCDELQLLAPLLLEADDSNGFRKGFSLGLVLWEAEESVFLFVLFSESFSVLIVISSREFGFDEVEILLGDLDRERDAGMSRISA